MESSLSGIDQGDMSFSKRGRNLDTEKADQDTSPVISDDRPVEKRPRLDEGQTVNLTPEPLGQGTDIQVEATDLIESDLGRDNDVKETLENLCRAVDQQVSSETGQRKVQGTDYSSVSESKYVVKVQQSQQHSEGTVHTETRPSVHTETRPSEPNINTPTASLVYKEAIKQHSVCGQHEESQLNKFIGVRSFCEKDKPAETSGMETTSAATDCVCEPSGKNTTAAEPSGNTEVTGKLCDQTISFENSTEVKLSNPKEIFKVPYPVKSERPHKLTRSPPLEINCDSNANDEASTVYSFSSDSPDGSTCRKQIFHSAATKSQPQTAAVTKPSTVLGQHGGSRTVLRELGQAGTDVKPAKQCVYIYNDEYLKLCDQMPRVPNRASMTHSLIQAYGLHEHVRCVSPRPARDDELTLFHSTDYVTCLKACSEGSEVIDDEAEGFGLTYDCPAYEGSFDYASYVVGASVKAAQCLMLGLCDVAINWPGGWHHSKRDEASGFCYLNDIVIAILKMRKKYKRVLYIDLDLHHGDGVEDAFCATDKVMTVSFHKYSPGFFPGSGKPSDQGIGKGKYYSLNIPLKDGIKDEMFYHVFNRTMSLVREVYEPEAVVCQCGADGLAGDPMDSFNLTPHALCRSVQHLQGWGIPLLLLGGGGYHCANTARCWAQITATVLGKTLPQEIPEHQYFTQYGPDYQLDIAPGNRSDHNSKEYVQELLQSVEEALSHVYVS